MRYDEFRDALRDALRQVGYVMWPARISETFDINRAARSWKVHLDMCDQRTVEPFHVSQEVSFFWSAAEFARTDTTEEDLLSELFGGHEDLPETLPRHLRIDMILNATLPWGSRTLMPSRRRWRSWSCAVDERMADILPTKAPIQGGEPVVVMAWRGMVELASHCADDGELCISRVSLPTWQAVVPPRIKDGADDDGDMARQLESVALRYRAALEEWAECVAGLIKLIPQLSNSE